MGIVDLVVIGIILIFALVGYYKGLIHSLLSLASFFIAFVIARVLAEPFVEHILKGIFGLDKVFTDLFVKNMAEEQEGLVFIMNTMRDTAVNLSDAVLTLIAVIILFIIIVLLLKFVIVAIDTLVKNIPIIKELNTVGGFLIGVAEGLLIVWIVMALLGLMSLIPEVKNLLILINDSVVGKFIYDNNLLIVWMLPNLLDFIKQGIMITE